MRRPHPRHLPEQLISSRLERLGSNRCSANTQPIFQNRNRTLAAHLLALLALGLISTATAHELITECSAICCAHHSVRGEGLLGSRSMATIAPRPGPDLSRYNLPHRRCRAFYQAARRRSSMSFKRCASSAYPSSHAARAEEVLYGLKGVSSCWRAALAPHR